MAFIEMVVTPLAVVLAPTGAIGMVVATSRAEFSSACWALAGGVAYLLVMYI